MSQTHTGLNATISYSDSTIRLYDKLIITIQLTNSKLTSISNFPEIEDFVKGATTFTKINGGYNIAQTYYPRRTGTYLVNPFYLSLNSISYRFPEKNIKVIPGGKQGKTVPNPAQNDYLSTHPEVGFVIATDKVNVHTGEGFRVGIHFLNLKSNKTEINFIDLQDQIKHMIPLVKPKYCWEEQSASSMEPFTDSTVINGKVYTRYTFYSSIFYPLQPNPVVIPAISFRFLKYRIYKTATMIDRLPDYVQIKSAAVTIKVLPTPSHPLKDRVPSGIFSLEDGLSSSSTTEGSVIKFKLSVKSDCGVSLIRAPSVVENKELDIYTPQVTTFLNPVTGIGRSTFDYQILCKKGGSYSIKDYFYWVYFDTDKKKYDTLFPKARVQVKTDTTHTALAMPVSDFYKEMIAKSSNNLRNTQKDEQIRWIANAVIMLMLVCTIVLMIKR